MYHFHENLFLSAVLGKKNIVLESVDRNNPTLHNIQDMPSHPVPVVQVRQ